MDLEQRGVGGAGPHGDADDECSGGVCCQGRGETGQSEAQQRGAQHVQSTVPANVTRGRIGANIDNASQGSADLHRISAIYCCIFINFLYYF